MCGECSQCLAHTGFAPAQGVCAFLVYTAQAPGCSAGELSKAGPGLCALPISKPLRFRFSGTPQRYRLGWACVLCPSQVGAAQATRCLASTVSPGGECILSTHQSLRLNFLGGSRHAHLRYAVCLFWGDDLWLQPSQRMSIIQNPKILVSNWKSACSLVEDASLGPRLALSGSG